MANDITAHGKNVFSITQFWDKELCQAIIAQAESANVYPSVETVAVQKTLEDNLDSRDSFRVYLESQELADIIYQYLHPSLPKNSADTFTPSGVHARLRVYKYLSGQEFKKHTDGAVVISTTEKSIYSLLIYLNDNFTGGTTIFDHCEIVPREGLAVFFPHELEHSGSVVQEGIKYVLRGNIIFKQKETIE
jgi:prolyl 4-hydroxylase